MGKNYCKVEKKWCRFCKHQTCHWKETNTLLSEIHRCPKRESTRTVRLKDYIADADIVSIMNSMIKWHPNEGENRNGYATVLNHLQNTIASKSDWFIKIETVHEPEHEAFGGIIPEMNHLHCNGIAPNKKEWGLSFTPWKEWLGMNIHPDTLRQLTKSEIIAECLYEMTFYGFTEDRVNQTWNNMVNNFEDLKETS